MTLSDTYKALTIDSILVSQKDNLRDMIGQALPGLKRLQVEAVRVSSCEVRACMVALQVVQDLWVRESYGYKFNELVRLADDYCSEAITKAEAEAAPTNKRFLLKELNSLRKYLAAMYLPNELLLVS